MVEIKYLLDQYSFILEHGIVKNWSTFTSACNHTEIKKINHCTEPIASLLRSES